MIYVYIQVLGIVVASLASFFIGSKIYRSITIFLLVTFAFITSFLSLKHQDALELNTENTVNNTRIIRDLSLTIAEHTIDLIRNIEEANGFIIGIKEDYKTLRDDQIDIVNSTKEININISLFNEAINKLNKRMNSSNDDIDYIINQNIKMRDSFELINGQLKASITNIQSLSQQNANSQENIAKTLKGQKQLLEDNQYIQLSLSNLNKSLMKIDLLFQYIANNQNIDEASRNEMIAMVGEVKGSLPVVEDNLAPRVKSVTIE